MLERSRFTQQRAPGAPEIAAQFALRAQPIPQAFAQDRNTVIHSNYLKSLRILQICA
jgi:hypothetical protein